MVVEGLLDAGNVELVVDVGYLEAQPKILVVEDTNVGLAVIKKAFHDPSRINEVVVKEGWQVVSVHKYLLGLFIICQGPHATVQLIIIIRA